jgi:hypothetical protein
MPLLKSVLRLGSLLVFVTEMHVQYIVYNDESVMVLDKHFGFIMKRITVCFLFTLCA